MIDRKGIIGFNTQITYGRAPELSPYQLRATRIYSDFSGVWRRYPPYRLPKVAAVVVETMTPIDFDEYNALRATIRERGTTRVWVVLIGTVGWAAAALATVGLAVPPIVTLIPLLVLATTFEITFALHTGVERIGRYIQVFFEDQAGGAAWEHRIMEFGRSGARRLSTDPLFVRGFLLGTLLNLLTVVVSGPLVIEWAVLGIAHALLAVRILMARREASGQRAADLARFRELKGGRT